MATTRWVRPEGLALHFFEDWGCQDTPCPPSLPQPTMKKLCPKLILLVVATGLISVSSSYADIQSPPGGKQTRVRKLSRAVANVIYGLQEVPYQWRRTLEEEGAVQAASYGVINGSWRTVVRAGYGAYEFALFPVRTYKGSFRPAYRGKSIWWDLNQGYHEFVPEMGFHSKYSSGRTQSW